MSAEKSQSAMEKQIEEAFASLGRASLVLNTALVKRKLNRGFLVAARQETQSALDRIKELCRTAGV